MSRSRVTRRLPGRARALAALGKFAAVAVCASLAGQGASASAPAAPDRTSERGECGGDRLCQRDRECKRVNDWLAESHYPERIDCLTVSLAPRPRCEDLNAFFLENGVDARFSCITRKVAAAEVRCADAFDNDRDGRVDARDPDCRAPDARLTKVKVRSRARKAAFRFKSVGGAGAVRMECKLDRRRWRQCSSPRRHRLRPGRHAFRVRAIDQLDRVDATPAKRAFVIRR